MKKYQIISLIVTLTVLLNGCASIVGGTNQPVSVETPNTKGATCSLTNDKGVWYVPETPSSVTVHRSFNDMNVECKKTGYQNSITAVKSKTKPLVFGNIIFGGLIGAGIDIIDGAAYDYPTAIQVPMEKTAYKLKR